MSKTTTFKQLFAAMERRQRARIRKAGKHTCIKKYAGAIRRVTGIDGRILKRPVAVVKLYECKICGKDMTNGPQEEH